MQVLFLSTVAVGGIRSVLSKYIYLVIIIAEACDANRPLLTGLQMKPLWSPGR